MLIFQMVDVNVVLNQSQASGTRLNIIILDACRNNPLGARVLRSSASGLAQIRAPDGTLISYAKQPGNEAVATDDTVTDCDRLAANPGDPQRLKGASGVRIWYEKAIAAGVNAANANLGRLYLEGNRVAKDVLRTRGRRPKPTRIKALTGNPGKRPLDAHEPRPEPNLPECPPELNPGAQREWTRLTASYRSSTM